MDQDLQRRIAARSPDAMYEIKTLLRSRCADKQLSAARVLEICLRAERITSKCLLRDFMLEEDVVGFLCDAMTTNSWPLLQRLTTILELLTDSDKMLLEGHAVLAAEASQRRLHFLGLMVGASADCEEALRDVLGLLATLLHRWGSASGQKRQVQGVSGLCPPMGMLSTLSLVLDAGLKGCTTTTTTLSAAQTLCSLLHHVVVGVEPGDPSSLAASVARCVRAALGSLQSALDTPAGALAAEAGAGPREDSERNEDDQLDEDREMACELLCSLASHMINARVACERALGPEDDALLVLLSLETEAQAVVMDKCLPLVVKVATASTKESREVAFGAARVGGAALGWQAEDEDDGLPALVGVLIDTLEACVSRGKDPVVLADQLVCQDFLWLLPALHQADRTNGSALRLTCAILAHLAYDLLDAGRWWEGEGEGGAESLAAFLYSAAPLLPARHCEWPSVLERWPYAPPLPAAGPPAAAQLFVLMISYFRSLAGGTCEQGEVSALAYCLPSYILSLPARTPVCILKTVWLSYAVHCLLAAAEEVSAESRAAGTRLATLLEQSEPGSVARAYTHHPAVLFWAFHARSGMPPRLQQSVADLWLSDGEAPSNVAPLLELLADQPAAVHPLLDVVTDGGAEARQRAARLLASAASSSAAVAGDLSAGLWARLPLALSGSSSRGRDCGLLVWLTAEVCGAPPADMALRVASLLAGALGRQWLGAAPHHLTAAMRILLHLLEDARRRCDPRVHTTLLSDARFAQALLAAARYRDPRTCTTALDLLRLLEQHKALLKVPVLLDPCTLELGVILLAVNSVDVQVFEAGLLLLQEVLRPKEHKFLTLEQDESFLRPIYFVLQSKAIKFKDLLTLGDAVWNVLRELLPLSEMIVHQPWNHTLVCFTLKQGPMQDASSEVLSFVLRWLTLLAPTEPPEPTPRRPLPSLLTETCVEIAAALVNSDREFRVSSIARDIGKALLNVTANLPASLQRSVEEIAVGL